MTRVFGILACVLACAVGLIAGGAPPAAAPVTSEVVDVELVPARMCTRQGCMIR